MKKGSWKKYLSHAVWDIAILLLGVLVYFGLYWLFHGSFEMVPTEEQQEKAQIGAVLWLMLTVPPLALSICMRLRKK